MSSALPPQPHLDVLRQQARQLHRAYRSADPEAFRRIRAYLPELRQASDATIVEQDLSLQSAQCVLAREYGFHNWSELTRAVETMRQAGPAMSRETDETLRRGQPLHVFVPEHMADEVWERLAGQVGRENLLRVSRDARPTCTALVAALIQAPVAVGPAQAVAFALMYERLGMLPVVEGQPSLAERLAATRAFVNQPFSDERSPLIISGDDGHGGARELISLHLTEFYPLYGSMADHRY